MTGYALEVKTFGGTHLYGTFCNLLKHESSFVVEATLTEVWIDALAMKDDWYASHKDNMMGEPCERFLTEEDVFLAARKMFYSDDRFTDEDMLIVNDKILIRQSGAEDFPASGADMSSGDGK